MYILEVHLALALPVNKFGDHRLWHYWKSVSKWLPILSIFSYKLTEKLNDCQTNCKTLEKFMLACRQKTYL